MVFAGNTREKWNSDGNLKLFFWDLEEAVGLADGSATARALPQPVLKRAGVVREWSGPAQRRKGEKE
jgi:hypothetical protein